MANPSNKNNNQILQYIYKNQDRFVQELFDLLKIPSVSTDPSFKEDIEAAASLIKQKLLDAGAEEAELMPTGGNPVIFGQKILDVNLPTLLVYGHYDVQPADPYELWNTPPFDPVIKDQKIYARGACDDKGQMYMHIKAFESMMATNNLPCNVKFLIEGEEEIGSDHLEDFVAQNKEKLKADVIVISDTAMLSNNTPSITTGLRGISYMEVEVSGPHHDLHSGVYGGAVVNPANALAKMVGQLKNDQNQVTIPGFYDKVKEISEEERQEIAKIPFDEEQLKKELGVDALDGEQNYSIIEAMGIRPTLDVNGIWGGYTGEGAKTIIPSKASAKISMRIVPDQNYHEINQLFSDYMQQIAPEGVRVNVKALHGGQPASIPLEDISMQAAFKAFEDEWGKKPIPVKSGASIPIVALFQKHLGLNAVLLGFGLDSDAIHAPNENFGLENYIKGMKTIAGYYHHFDKLKRYKE